MANGKKLKFRGVATVGRNLKAAASSFVRVIAGQQRQLIVATDGSVYAVNKMPQVKYWDPKSGVAHASELKKELNLTLASDGTDGEGIRAFTCACTGCKEIVLAETKLDHCLLCASEIAPEEYEEVELDIPSNEELDAMAEEDCEDDSDNEGFDALEEDLEEDEDDTDEEFDALEEDLEEDEDLEIGDELEDDEDLDLDLEGEEDLDALEETEDETLEDEELIGDDLEEDVEDEDLDLGDELEGEDVEDEDADLEIGDELEEDVEEDDLELGDELEEDEDEDIEVGDELEEEICEEDDEDLEGDDIEVDEEPEVETEDADGDFYIDDEGSVNIDLVDGAELEEGDECDVEYSASMNGTKRWIASVNGLPVATATQATAGTNKEIFHTEAFGKVAKQVIASSGVAGLKGLGFTSIVVAAPVRGLIQASVNAEIAKSEKGFEKKISTLAADFTTSLGMAAAGINRGFFGDVINPLKVRMWEELSAMSIPQPHRVIDRVFKETAEDFCRILIEKASDLQAKPAEIRAELSKAIIGSNYLAVAEDEDVEEASDEFDVEDDTSEETDAVEAASSTMLGRNRVTETASSVVSGDAFSASLDSVFKTL